METMFVEYLVKRLLVTPNCDEKRRVVDESHEMFERPMTGVGSASGGAPEGFSMAVAPARSTESNIKMDEVSNHDTRAFTHPTTFVDATIGADDQQSLTISILDLEEARVRTFYDFV